MGELLQKAIEYAVEKHSGDVRKGTSIPYIVHPVEVMKITSGITEDEEVRAAAVLHDTVEDTGATQNDIRERFGDRVCGLVLAESENKREGIPEVETWEIRKRETVEKLEHADRDAKIICLADKLANIRDIYRDYKKYGEKLWGRFSAPDDNNGNAGKKARIGGYYRGIADGLKSELGEEPAWKELDELTAKVFEGKN